MIIIMIIIFINKYGIFINKILESFVHLPWNDPKLPAGECFFSKVLGLIFVAYVYKSV